MWGCSRLAAWDGMGWGGVCLSLLGAPPEESSPNGEKALCAAFSPHRDSLLLETGFLAVLVAPLRQPPHRKQAPQSKLAGASPHEGLSFWLVRWLLFRLMFASGVVKLTSRCPAWWGLTGEDPCQDLVGGGPQGFTQS